MVQGRQVSSSLVLDATVSRLHPFLQKQLFWKCLEELGLGGGAFRSTHAQMALSLLRRGKGSVDLPESVRLKVDREGLHVTQGNK